MWPAIQLLSATSCAGGKPSAMVGVVSMNFFRRFSGCYGIFKRIVLSDVFAADHRTPFSFSSHPSNAELFSGAGSSKGLVLVVFAPGDTSKIAPAIIGGVPVYVVDILQWPFASHHCPNHSMRREEVAPKRPCRVAFDQLRKCLLVGIPYIPSAAGLIRRLAYAIKHVGSSPPPVQLPRLRVVAEQLAACDWGDIGFVSHGAGSLRLVRVARSLVASARPVLASIFSLRSQQFGAAN